MTPGDSFFYDIDSHQRFKHGQEVCGDVFMSRKIETDDRIVCVLSDGLGSGIKASVLATLTASMATEYALNRMGVHQVARSIMSTLPIDRVRHISYSTFSIISLDYRGSCTLVEFDNPPFLLFRGGERLPVEKQVVKGRVGRNRTYSISVSQFKVKTGDRIVLFTDGVTQSGIGTDQYPFGWEEDAIDDYCRFLVGKNEEISAREFAHEIVEHALANNLYRAQDDITCAVINVRHPKKLLVVTGPPFDKQNDSYIAYCLASYEGKKVVCGGTTANIVARELNREVETDLDTLDPLVPCVSYMEGVDLITEGMITVGRAHDLLEQECPAEEMAVKNGATMLIDLFLQSDIIDFIVGNKVNEAHQDPTLPIELGIRRNIIRQMARLLDERYMKQVSIKFI